MKSFFFKTFAFFINIFSKLGNGKYLSYLNEYIRPMAEVTCENFKMYFNTPNFVTYWRAESFFSKEPETIKWINSFKPNETLFDVGANVGIYSIYAAKQIPNLKVYSFEPTFFNFYLLNKNIFVNQLKNKVTAICLALSDKNAFDYIHMPAIVDGSAMVNFGSNLDLNREEFKAEFVQGSLAYSLDSFISTYKLDVPDHLKIDVDGLEYEIILGAKETLKNPKLKSVLIELNDALESDQKVREIILTSGFTLKEKTHGEVFNDPNSKFNKIYNNIFERI